MFKVLLLMLATAALVLFGIQNSDHVAVSFVVGGPKQVRLIFVLLIAGTAGFVLSYIFTLNREIRFKKEVRRLIEARQTAPERSRGEKRKVRKK